MSQFSLRSPKSLRNCHSRQQYKFLFINIITFFLLISNNVQVHGQPHVSLIDTDVRRIKFYLFPKAHDLQYKEELLFGDMNSVRKSSFRPNILTCFLTHGFLDDYKGLEAIKDAYLKQGFQANIIVMDWSALSQPRFPKNFVELFGILFSYKDVLNNLEPIAMRIAMFIQMLVHNNIATLNKLHLIGHSLGAHISGNVGKHIRTQLFPGMKAERVTGLDPAGPAFVPPLLGPVIPMDPADANFVDSIHSDADLNGIPIDDGIVDFFPNGGQDQPGCFPISDCSHKYAINIYAASVSKKYVGCQCDIHFLSTPALGSFSLGSITLDRCLLPCIYPTYLGPYCSHEAKGDFYLKAPNPP